MVNMVMVVMILMVETVRNRGLKEGIGGRGLGIGNLESGSPVGGQNCECER